MADNPAITEVWKTIAKAPDYQVSSLGRVKRAVANPSPKARFPVGHIFKQSKSGPKRNYYCVGLSVNGKATSRIVHRLVAEAFLPPIPSPMHQVRHLDGNSLNNRSDNLDWGTQKENEADKIAHGTLLRGEDSTSELTESDVRAIRIATDPQIKIAARFGVTQTTVSRIKRRARWAWLD